MTKQVEATLVPKAKKKTNSILGYLSGESKDQQQTQQEEPDKQEETEVVSKLPSHPIELRKLLFKVKNSSKHYREKFFSEHHNQQNKKSQIDDNAIPINADVRTFNYDLLRETQLNFGKRLFDVIMMDPPWQLSSSQPSRGVAIAYDTLNDDKIQKIPIDTLQTDGFIFIWAINAKYRLTCKLMENWGYKQVDQITWIKKTVNGKIAKGHGFYLQHAKESCLIGVKGNIDPSRLRNNIASDVIFSARRGQSQKPEEIYQYVEELVPNGFYLEIFGRRNNIRKNWVTIGNEI